MISVAVIAALLLPATLLIVATWLLARRGPWLLAWLRGSAIFAILGYCYLMLATSLEVLQLEHYSADSKVADIRIQAADGRYLVSVDSGEQVSSLLLDGDAVKLRYRSLQLTGPMQLVTDSPFLSLHSVDSRFYEFERQYSSRRVKQSRELAELSFGGVEQARFAKIEPLRPVLKALGIDSGMLSVDYIPLQHEALYELHWQGGGFQLEAANTPAHRALHSATPLAAN